MTRWDKWVQRNPAWPIQLHISPNAAPHKVALLCLAFFGGVAGLLVGDARSSAVASAFIDVPVWVFYAGFAFSSAVALFGVWKRGLDGMFIERIGLVGATFICAAYTMAVIFSVGPRGLFAALFFVAFSVANIVRINIINRDVMRVRTVLGELPSSEDREAE